MSKHAGTMDFGLALKALKAKQRVSREGWNGQGMWLQLEPYTTRISADGAPQEVLPYIEMKTVDDKYVPWLASQTDLLADDWVIV